MSKTTRFFTLFAVLILLLLAGCQTADIEPTPAFTAVDEGASLPPQVIAITPSGGQEMALDGTIEITFDQAMAPDATGAAWSLVDFDGKTVPGDVTWLDESTLRFTPDQPLESSTTYAGTLSTDALSAEGVAIEDEYSYTFNTIGELLVDQVFPADGSTEVENVAIVTVVFNRPMVPITIVEDQADLPDPLEITPVVKGSGEWLNTSVYVFQPEEALQSSTTYTVRIPAEVSDFSGATLDEGYEWQFTTAPSTISYFTLIDLTTNPGDYYIDVPLDQTFEIGFDQPMDQAATEDAFSLVSENGEQIPATFDWDDEAMSMTIILDEMLEIERDYILRLSDRAKDTWGSVLEEGLTWHFTTYRYPAVTHTYPENGTFQSDYSGRVRIYFSSPIDIDTYQDKIILTPAPEEEIEWTYNPWSWSVSYYGLEPSTTYQVQVLPGITDIYGNPITKEYTSTFTTAAYRTRAYLEMPYGPAMYRLDAPQQFFVRYVNSGPIDLALYQLTVYDFISIQSGRIPEWEYEPPQNDLIWEIQHTPSEALNDYVLQNFPLQTADGEELAPGFYFLTMGSWQGEGYYRDERAVMVVDSNLTLKTTLTDALVWLTDLESGAPLSDMPVTIYDKGLEPVASGMTDADGLLALELPIAKDIYEARYALSDDGRHFAFASNDWGSGVSPYDFGIYSAYYVTPDEPVTYIYTDRPLYRPGHPVSFKGIIRLNDDLAYSLPEHDQIFVTINNYDETIYEKTLELSEFGSFSGELLLDENATLGFYSISAYFPNSDIEIGSGYFSVGEYRKPEFQVDVAADPSDVLPGEEIDFTVEATFFAGGAVSNSVVDWGLYASSYTFSPGGDLSRYNFHDYERDTGYGYDFGYGDELIAEGLAETDENGQVVITLPAELGEAGDSQNFSFEATITDIAGNAVSARDEVIAHQAAVYVGVRSEKYVGQAEKEQTFELVAVDWSSDPVPEQLLNVEIVERRWHSVQTQNADGSIEWETTVEDIPVVSFEDVETDTDGYATVSFTPTTGGVYKAIATTLDEDGNQAQAAAYMWVSSSEYISWRRTDDRAINLVIDRDSYTPGDTAEILIASPFQGESYALVTVERGHVRASEVILLETNSYVYELPITADMAPNVYVSVTVVKGADENSPPDFRMGMAELSVETNQQAINVEVTAEVETAGPGDDVTYTVQTTDLDGEPVSAEVSLALTDLATLTLSSPNSSPILEYFYSPRSLSVWTAVPIVYSMEHYNVPLEDLLAEGEGMGSGGGKGSDEYGVIDIREDFPDTAYWTALLVTDENGQTSVTVTLPDNLTTWRMDGRAVTMDTRVGDSTMDLVSTKPLLLRPQTPRFFVVQDESRLGAVVHNNSEDDLSVEVTLDAEGVVLLDDETQTVEIAAGERAFVTWQATVLSDAKRVDLVFSVKGGGYSDASRPTMGTLSDGGIPVYKYEAPETVGTAGMLTEGGSRTEAINLPSEMGEISTGDLTIQIEPSLVAGMAEGLDYLEHYPYECVEQTISRFLPNVLTTQALQAAGRSDIDLQANLETQVGIALQRLYAWQNADGGWGWWSGYKSSTLTTAYATLGLIEAEQAGYAVSPDVIRSALNYLGGNLGTVRDLDNKVNLNRQAFLVYVLTRGDKPNVSRAVQLYNQRGNMSLYARAFLLQTLHLIDPDDPRIDTLISDFNNAAITSATGTHWEEGWRDYWNWNTDTRTTAIVLGALIQVDPENALNVNTVRWLMTHRYQGRWRSTQETAWTLIGLTAWMQATGELEADYLYAISLNGEHLDDSAANAENLTETYELRLDVAEMFADQTNRLTIARDDGPGNLYYTAHLNVDLPVEQLDALDRGIIVSRSYFHPDDRETPITQTEQGDILLARLTIVAPGSLHYVLIDDPLPAGLEAVDQRLETSPQESAPDRYDYEDLWSRGWGWWYFDHVELRDERVVISADYLPAGTYVYTYLVRASTPGEFRVIPSTAQEFYFPEVYGRGEGSLFVVEP